MHLQITARSIKDELESRGYEVDVIVTANGPILSFDHNGRRRHTLSSSPDLSTNIASVICNDKVAFDRIAQRSSLPVPSTETYQDEEQVASFLSRFGRIVVKPAAGAHGNGITINITDSKAAIEAVAIARSAYPDGLVILQQQVHGDDYRLLVIAGKLAAASKRVPATVTGNGASTIEDLIHSENEGDTRTELYSNRQCKIDEEKAWTYLGSRRSEVPADGQVVQVVGTANIGSGGHAEDTTDDIPAHVIDMAVTLCESIGAFVCGVDFMHDDSSDEWHLIEANTAPSFGLHMNPLHGKSRPVVRQFIDALLNG